MQNEKQFKVCSTCGFIWKSREAFLTDKNIKLIGYQPHFQDLKIGLFLFDHSCETTLSIQARNFFDLYDGPIFTEKLKGTRECPRYCLNKNELRSCKLKCECAFVREILQILQKMNKQ